MKYLVSKETKEHVILREESYPCFPEKWDIVEADAEGWIPWNGGECPLPDGHAYNFTTARFPRKDCEDIYLAPEDNNWGDNGKNYVVTSYRPIIADKESLKKFKACDAPMKVSEAYIEHTEAPSVFDRLKSAVEAAESIPAILAEINALLPDGYCVTKREVVNMQDWRNWEKGDFVTVHGRRGGYSAFDFKEGRPYEILSIEKRKDDCIVGLDSDNDHKALNFLAEEIEADELRFHSRPVKS